MEQNGTLNKNRTMPNGPMLVTYFDPERTIDLGPFRRQFILFDEHKTRVIGSAASVNEYLELMDRLDSQGVKFIAAGQVPNEFSFWV